MARWEPDARERLVLAATELFADQGYDATTIAQIAERAGLTKSTFFRYFPDKRELLVAGQEALSRLLEDGIREAPSGATPLAAVAAGLERAAGSMTPLNRELAPRVRDAVAADVELQARDALKTVGLTAAMMSALTRRGVPETAAKVAAELGALAFKIGFARWTSADSRNDTSSLTQHTLAALEEVRAATAGIA